MVESRRHTSSPPSLSVSVSAILIEIQSLDLIMADPHLLAEAGTRPDSQTPLLNNNPDTGTADEVRLRKLEENPPPEDDCDTDLDKTLNRLETFLTLLGFSQSSPSSFGLSWVVFLLIGVALPVAVLVVPKCHGCEKFQIDEFEIDIVVSQACLAAVSLLCLSHNLRKYGIRKFLFVDRHSGQMARFRDEYIKKIRACARLLVLWTLPCFTLKTGREIARIVYMPRQSWWWSGAVLFALIISWIYVTAIYLSACIVFHLVCNLQIIHFDDYGKRFGSDSDVIVLIEEHVRLRYNLSKISHRFRIYLILVFTVVTASLFVALFQMTGYNGLITLINSGDLAISSVVQVAGITLCLNAAAKISHRAQGIASLASRWHAIATCSSRDAPQMRDSNSLGNLRTLSSLGAIPVSNSESDLDSLDYNVAIPRHLPSYMSSYHKRQAFVLYLQMNPGGITIFGWTVDRGLINTIFFIQLSLVLFVLGKTVVNASEND